MKVKFIEENVDEAQIRWGGHNDPRGILEVGKEYELAYADVHSSHTRIVLTDFPMCQFNSVWFTWSETDDIFELTGAKDSWMIRNA